MPAQLIEQSAYTKRKSQKQGSSVDQVEWNRGRGTRAVKRALRCNRNDRVAACSAVIIEKPTEEGKGRP